MLPLKRAKPSFSRSKFREGIARRNTLRKLLITIEGAANDKKYERNVHRVKCTDVNYAEMIEYLMEAVKCWRT